MQRGIWTFSFVAVFDVVDDTKLVQKALLDVSFYLLLPNIKLLVHHLTGKMPDKMISPVLLIFMCIFMIN